MVETDIGFQQSIRRVETEIGFRFRGGIAQNGQLSFYEAGRYRYAAARMLYTIEHFRNTGEVLQRLNKMTDADFRVTAASTGSFFEAVTHYAAPLIADVNAVQGVLHIPFGKLFPYILSKVIPKVSGSDRLAIIADKQADALIELAKAFTERERTARVQSEQDTERLRIIAGMLKRDPGGLRSNTVETEEVSQIVARYVDTPAQISVDEGSSDFIASELQDEVNRNRIIEEADADLNKLDTQVEQELIIKVRKLLPEVGTPLKRSASRMNLELGSRPVTIASLNQARINQIGEEKRDERSRIFEGSIKKLDKETGYGRFRPVGSKATLSFSIPREIFDAERISFVTAFSERQVEVEALPFRDSIGNIVRLTIIRVRPSIMDVGRAV